MHHEFSCSEDAERSGPIGSLLVSARLQVVLGVVCAVLLVAVFGFALHLQGGRYDGPTPASAPMSPTAATAEVDHFPIGPKLHLPKNPKVLVFGDSWAAGYAAVPYTDGFMYLTARKLRWRMTITEGGSGTGWLVGNPDKSVGNYAQRIRAQHPDRSVDLVVLQGSINDSRNDNASSLAFNSVVEAAVKAARSRYANAQIVVVGPLPPTYAGSGVLKHLDDRLNYEADRLHTFDYISPVQEGWISTDAARAKYINADAQYHPNNAGHALLAELFMADLRKLST